MNLMKKVLKNIKNELRKIYYKTLSEDQYYERLFIKDAKWNSPRPNVDEQRRWQVIEEFIESIKLPDDTQILDLGCGRGWLSNLLTKYGEVIGIEPVKKVAEYAKKLFPPIQFKSGTSKDLLNQNFANRFDLIASSEVIEHVSDDQKPEFVRDINKLLKANGYAIITTPRKEALKDWATYAGIDQPVEEWISEAALEQLFTDQGFSAINNRRIPVLFNETDTIDVYQAWLFKKNE